MTRDEAINESERIDRFLEALNEVHRLADKLQGEYGGVVDRLMRHADDELANELPGNEAFPIQVGDVFLDVGEGLVVVDKPGEYRVLEADEKRVILLFPNGSTNTVEYRTAAFDAAKERGWLSREDLVDVGLLFTEG
jgi:hypothetical protein